MSELLLLIHDEKTTTGTTVEWCLSRGIDFEIKVAKDALFDTESVSTLSNYKGLVVFGGDMETWETEKYPWLNNEKDLVKRYLENEKHYFGLCLGAQLLAEQSGGKVFPDQRGWELGWIDVTVRNLAQKLTVLAWHSSTFEPGPGTEIIARNNEDQNEALRVSPKALGFQFHMEIDEARLAHALAGYNEANWGRIESVKQLREGFLRHHQDVKSWYFASLDQWWNAK